MVEVRIADADWHEVARIVLHIDPDREPEPGAPGLRELSPALDGCHSMDIGTCFAAAGLARR
jgi:hypothetical protein